MFEACDCWGGSRVQISAAAAHRGRFIMGRMGRRFGSWFTEWSRFLALTSAPVCRRLCPDSVWDSDDGVPIVPKKSKEYECSNGLGRWTSICQLFWCSTGGFWSPWSPAAGWESWAMAAFELPDGVSKRIVSEGLGSKRPCSALAFCRDILSLKS